MRLLSIALLTFFIMGCGAQSKPVEENKPQPNKSISIPIQATNYNDEAVIYKGFRIDRKTDVRTMIKKLGKGTLVKDELYHRFRFWYPSDKEWEFIVETENYKKVLDINISRIGTSKVKAGQPLNKLVEAYGKPKEEWTKGGIIIYYFDLGDRELMVYDTSIYLRFKN